MNTSFDPAIDWLADAALTPQQRQVWNQLRSEFVEMRDKLADLDKKIKMLQREASENQPQSVLTRPEFNREVARMLAFDERYGGTSSVLYYDFENLDEVTAQFGKSVANAALQEIGKTLMKHVRGSDVVGRLAADEFGILLMRCDNDNAWKKGKSIAQALQEKLAEVHGCKLDISISYGAYTFREDEDVNKGLKEAAQMVTKVGTVKQ
jgi:diguanylate cyclase (GGDEF)-like protein